MIEINNLTKAAFEAGRELLRSPQDNKAKGTAERTPPCLVPIRSLGANHRERIAKHLLLLDEHDRYLRFGYIAHDEQIQRYVDGLDFDRDEIFGVYNRKLELIAMAHLACAPDPSCESCAEFGVSVLLTARGRGFGARLFDRAAMTAANNGVGLIFMHALSENEAMLKIARAAGVHIEREGSESEAYLKLPTPTMDSRMTEMLDETVALADYRIKVQAKQFRSFMADVQAFR